LRSWASFNEQYESNRLFRYGCLFVGVIYALLAGSILSRGVETSMQPFGVPNLVLDSPYYVDAIRWVYAHMFVLGILIGLVGWFTESLRFQRVFSAALLAIHFVYLCMDLRTSYTAIGNG
jgi:H+/Cl- antiporter ClcA